MGPINVTAPNPVTNAEFTKSLGRALHRPALFIAPGFMLRAALGEMSDLVLKGQKVLPDKLLKHGYQFQFENLDAAFQDILNRSGR
ncbi:MAG: DUF1731 domain-containing protein [Pseudomonadota bacterium]